MKLISNSKKINKKPFESHVWVEDLVYFDGPLLSFVRGNSQQDFFYLWCDSDGEDNIWAAIPVNRDQIKRYKDSKVSLKDIIFENEALFYVCLDNELEVSRAYFQLVDYFPEEYSPADDSFFDSDLCPTGNDVLESSSLYDLNIDGEWFFEDLFKIPKRYIQLYSFVYTLKNLSKASIRQNAKAIFRRYPMKGGASYVNLYKDLHNSIPSLHEPRVNKIQYASPGMIQLDLLGDVSSDLESVILYADQNRKELEKALKNLRGFLKEKGLLSTDEDAPTILLNKDDRKLVSDSSRMIMGLIGLEQYYEDMHSLSNNPVVTAKVVMSVARRMEPILEYKERDMIKF